MTQFALSLIEGGYKFGHAACLANAVEGTGGTAEEDDTVGAPRSAHDGGRNLAEGLWRTATGVYLLERARDAEADETAVGRPERSKAYVFRAWERPRFQRVERAHPHHAGTGAGTGDKCNTPPVGRYGDTSVCDDSIFRRRNLKTQGNGFPPRFAEVHHTDGNAGERQRRERDIRPAEAGARGKRLSGRPRRGRCDFLRLFEDEPRLPDGLQPAARVLFEAASKEAPNSERGSGG
jgi:hypothetical protein